MVLYHSLSKEEWVIGRAFFALVPVNTTPHFAFTVLTFLGGTDINFSTISSHSYWTMEAAIASSNFVLPAAMIYNTFDACSWKWLYQLYYWNLFDRAKSVLHSLPKLAIIRMTYRNDPLHDTIRFFICYHNFVMGFVNDLPSKSFLTK